jgi:LPXTG-site transpeptidase (sortase) family protein
VGKRPQYLVALLAALVAVAAAAVAAGRGPGALRAVRVLGAQITPAPQVQAAEPVSPAPVSQPFVQQVVPHSSVPRSASAAPRPVDGFIQIPSIGVNGPLVAVGLDASGQMITPTNARDIAWYDTGSFPGPTHNAILAGHRNWNGRQGTFANLESVKPGDLVKVGMGGMVFTFKVDWVRLYDPRNAPVKELLGDTAVDSVTLVTCGGEFNPRIGHYDHRVVVRAELVPDA